VVPVVLAAAVLHAAWNSLAKTVGDQLVGFMVLDLTGMATCVAALPLVAAPAAASWPFIAGSACLHVGYKLALMASYRTGELSQVYPLARGVAPLLVAAFAAAFVGERPGPAQLGGVVLVSCGLASLALGAAARAPPPAPPSAPRSRSRWPPGSSSPHTPSPTASASATRAPRSATPPGCSCWTASRSRCTRWWPRGRALGAALRPDWGLQQQRNGQWR